MFNINEFKDHFLKCEKFKKRFDIFDYLMVQLLKNFINSLNDALIVKIFLQQYLKVINKKIDTIQSDLYQFDVYKSTIIKKKSKIELDFSELKLKESEINLNAIKSKSTQNLNIFNNEKNDYKYKTYLNEIPKNKQNKGANIIKISSNINKEEYKTIINIISYEYYKNKNNFNSNKIRNLTMTLKTIFLKDFFIFVRNIGNFDEMFSYSSEKSANIIEFILEDKQFLIIINY
jgi:hypothetical protein